MIYYLKRMAWILTVLLIVIFVLTSMNIIYDGFNDKIHKSDVAIILGSKVGPNGMPSARLAARLNKGLELYQEGIVNTIIVSGGTGKEDVDEALVMKNYLIAHQVPVTAIIADSHGNNTEATARNSYLIMQAHGFKSALVVSQYFHIKRARLALKRCGISPIYTAHANYFEWRDIYSTAREVVGLYYYLLFQRDCQVSST